MFRFCYFQEIAENLAFNIISFHHGDYKTLMRIHLIIVWMALLRCNCVCDLITLLVKCHRERVWIVSCGC